LVRDSGADVAIVDSDGRVLYACPRNRWWSFALEGDAAVGRTLGELMGKEIGDERVELIRKACHEGVPYTILGMSRGVRTKTTVRPFQAGPESSLSRRHALLIGRAAQEGAAADTHDPAIDGPIVSARNLDLGPLATLTPRELDVLALIGKGLSTADIAAAMHRSVKTIEAHRLSLGMKLKARNRVELARIALRAGLTSRSLSFTHDAGPATVR
jgi:DNA-binding NarL/FixJ family response regulator